MFWFIDLFIFIDCLYFDYVVFVVYLFSCCFVFCYLFVIAIRWLMSVWDVLSVAIGFCVFLYLLCCCLTFAFELFSFVLCFALDTLGCWSLVLFVAFRVEFWFSELWCVFGCVLVIYAYSLICILGLWFLIWYLLCDVLIAILVDNGMYMDCCNVLFRYVRVWFGLLVLLGLVFNCLLCLLLLFWFWLASCLLLLGCLSVLDWFNVLCEFSLRWWCCLVFMYCLCLLFVLPCVAILMVCCIDLFDWYFGWILGIVCLSGWLLLRDWFEDVLLGYVGFVCLM